MIDINDFYQGLMAKHKIIDKNFNISFALFMNSNGWFGNKIKKENNKVYIENDFSETALSRINDFCIHYQDDFGKKYEMLLEKFGKKFPDTKELFVKFAKQQGFNDETSYYLVDIMNKNLFNELRLCFDTEVDDLVKDACEHLNSNNTQQLVFFILHVRDNYETKYKDGYKVNKRFETDSTAYDMDVYLEIMYRLFNKDYVDENCMFQKAAESKDYTDTWLFLGLHFISAIRNTDLVLFPHPLLPKKPEEIIDEVKNDRFERWEQEYVVKALLTKIESVNFRPNKTKRYSGIADIKFFIPTSCIDIFGTLFALAEAHYQLSGSNGPLIREIYKYKQIRNYMGDEIGELFVEGDFRSRSANKSYMQSIDDLAKEIIDVDDSYSIKGYMLAALARSHKGSYGSFAHTTFTYLKDAKMTGHTPEFVAKELFERGVLSYFSSILLKLLTQDKYSDFSMHQQTEMIKMLGMTNNEIEGLFIQLNNVKKESYELAKALMSDRKKAILILHTIANGNAPAKQKDCDCFYTSIGMPCPNKGKTCINKCMAQIKTRTTLYMLLDEFNRQKQIYKTTDNPLLKLKSKDIAKNTIGVALNEMIECAKETYGQKAVDDLERIIKFEREIYKNSSNI